jgi:hypothetical protein
MNSTTPSLRLILKLLGLQERISKAFDRMAYSLPSPSSRVHVWAIFMSYAKISQFESSLRFENLVALFRTQSNVYIFHSLQRAQHATTDSRIRRTSNV